MLRYKSILLFGILLSIGIVSAQTLTGNCTKDLHETCYHRKEFSDAEIDQVRVYIQNRFIAFGNKYPALKPKKAPCSKIYLRRDFKCLTENQRMTVVNGFKCLYRNGYMDFIRDVHVKYWPYVHKASVFRHWHRWFMNDLNKALLKCYATDLNLTESDWVHLPYWEVPVEFQHPDRSIVWNYFGHSGSSPDWCVNDGPLYGGNYLQNLSPQRDCLRRQWSPDGTLRPFAPPEFETISLRYSVIYLLLSFFLTNQHFKTHLYIGGYNGQMSVPEATYDAIFHLYHQWDNEVSWAKYQLLCDANLVPLTYDLGVKILYPSGLTVLPNLATDTLEYWNVSVIEASQFTFGELCYVTDQIAEAVLNTLNNVPVPTPRAINRMNPVLRATYFPIFYSPNVTHFDSQLPDIGDCNEFSINPFDQCKKIIKEPSFTSDANSQRQLAAFDKPPGLPISLLALTAELLYNLTMDSFNFPLNGYCSIYAD